jgi:hypothetical protein
MPNFPQQNPDPIEPRSSLRTPATPEHALARVQRAIIQKGGIIAPALDAHRARPINYAADPPGLIELRKTPPASSSTCACGRAGVMVSLPNAAGDGRVDACIVCDAVDRMPKFRPGHA